jgi:hypothetical protein
VTARGNAATGDRGINRIPRFARAHPAGGLCLRPRKLFAFCVTRGFEKVAAGARIAAAGMWSSGGVMAVKPVFGVCKGCHTVTKLDRQSMPQMPRQIQARYRYVQLTSERTAATLLNLLKFSVHGRRSVVC